MAKLLVLIRHATAEDGSHVFKDFDRELTSKGIMEASKMGKALSGLLPSIDIIISSQAKRAAKTAQMIAEQNSDSSLELSLNENLYGGGPRAYLSLINSLSNEEVVIVVGHNPDISFFAEYLTRDDVGGSFEKCTAVALQLIEGLEWSELSSKTMVLKWRKSIQDIDG